ncbi:hypothetical protein GCM10027269_20450 [Kribbella endophytica]
MLWYDLDYAETVALRERLYDERPSYKMIGSSVTHLDWIDELPTDRPTFVVAEGLTMYLDRMAAPALFSALVRRSHATLGWGVDNARELEPLGLTPLDILTAPDFVPPGYEDRLSRSLKAQLRLTRAVPPLARMGQILHYSFGPGLSPTR